MLPAFRGNEFALKAHTLKGRSIDFQPQDAVNQGEDVINPRSTLGQHQDIAYT